MIERAIAILQQARFDLTARELAEIIWLAVHIEESEQLQQQSQQFTLSKPERLRTNQPQTQTQETPEIASSPQATEPRAEVYLPSSVQSPAKSPESREAIAIKVPAAIALRNSLALGRALRPLMRKIPSPTENILDEEATVCRIAQEKLWVPVLKPAPERWLELALVVEQSSSTAIWKQTITELQRLLKHHGAFRDVRTWELKVTETKAQLFPQNSTGAYSSTPHSPEILIDPKGQRLILLVSDCISPAWRRRFIHPVLKLWGRKGLITILQLLPERLWERTALASEIPVQLHSLNPGVFNSQLIVETWDDETTDEIENIVQEDGNIIINSIPVPIITLEPEPLLKWSRVIAGLGNVKTAGFKFSSVNGVEHSDTQQFTEHKELNLTPAALVSRFRATASPLARRLAGLMAAAPVSLPVVQLIQQTLLSQSSQIHVAEVFMSGLLKPLTSIRQDTDADYIEYEFVEGVRELLLESVPVSKTISVIDNVSEFVAKRLGLSVREFEARLLVAASQGKDSLETKIRPFAQFKAQVLRQLGREYARFAEELDPQYKAKPTSLKNYWLFQGNPKSYRMLDAIRDLEEIFWSINRYKKDIAVGDGVLIWVSGKESGIYAFGEVIEPVKKLEELPEIDYWIDTSLLDTKRNQDQVRIRLTSKLLEKPLLRKELKQDFILNNLAVIRLNRGSIFKVTPEEWRRVHELKRLGIELAVTTKSFEFEVVTVHSTGDIIKRKTKQAQYFTEDLGNSITLEMVAIPGGKFMMGSPEGEGCKSEKPQHEVTVQPFFMGKYLITQAQWRAVAALPRVNRDLNPEPSYFKGDNLPVEQVSWYDAVEFCARLSRKTGREYRLPSEAEWEYACRAGTITPFHFGETITYELANYDARVTFDDVRGTFDDVRGTFDDAPQGQYREQTTPVGTFPPNAFGLYDMHGNVWEWCGDAWHENYQGAPTDGTAWTNDNNQEQNTGIGSRLTNRWKNIRGQNRLLRGGSWGDAPENCRCAYRVRDLPDDVSDNDGFRVVCSVAAIALQ
jgi:formylglycine-generating enzyme required for sulfatase activity